MVANIFIQKHQLLYAPYVLFLHAFIMAVNIFIQKGFSYKTCAIEKPYGLAAPILPSISKNNLHFFGFNFFLPSWFLAALWLVLRGFMYLEAIAFSFFSWSLDGGLRIGLWILVSTSISWLLPFEVFTFQVNQLNLLQLQ